jgi:predicted ribosome-associated RNA-binding protein Tma20
VLKDIILLESGSNDEINNFQDCFDPTPKLTMDVIELNLVEHNKNKWYVNSGAIKHVTRNGDVLIEFKKEDGIIRVSSSHKMGNIVISIKDEIKGNALYVLRISNKLCL